MKNTHTLLVCLFLFNTMSSFAQRVKILECENIKYYHVYKVFDFDKKDTLIMLSSKNDIEFKIFKLNINKCYEIKTRFKSAIKISKEEYLFCKPTIIVIEKVTISNKGTLPILIENYKEINHI